MKRLAALLLIAGCAHVHESAPSRGDSAAEVWSRYADSVDDAEVSVALVREGVPTFAGDPKAIYRIGEFTGFFVIESALRMEDRGAIDLDRSPVAFAKFALAPRYADVSMRELAELRAELIDDDGSLVPVVERFLWASDARIALFAAVLEDAVGKSVAEIVRDEITLPLQLHDTSFTPASDKTPRVAARGEPFGGLYSSVEDCVKFFASSKRLRESALMRSRTVRGVALGYAVGRVRGGRRFVAFPAEGSDFLLVFRNRTGWMGNPDFKYAAEIFAE